MRAMMEPLAARSRAVLGEKSGSRMPRGHKRPKRNWMFRKIIERWPERSGRASPARRSLGFEASRRERKASGVTLRESAKSTSAGYPELARCWKPVGTTLFEYSNVPSVSLGPQIVRTQRWRATRRCTSVLRARMEPRSGANSSAESLQRVFRELSGRHNGYGLDLRLDRVDCRGKERDGGQPGKCGFEK